MARWRSRIRPVVGQSLPIILLFVFGMLCGTLWNRSGRSVTKQQDPIQELVPAFVEENDRLQVEPINLSVESKQTNVERETSTSGEEPKHSDDIVGVSDQGPETKRKEVEVVSGREESATSSSSSGGSGSQSFEDFDDEEERIFKKEDCMKEEVDPLQEALAKSSSNSSSIRSYNKSYDLMLNSLKCGKTIVYTSYDHEGLLLYGHVYSVTHHTGQYYGPPLAPHSRSFQVLRNDIIESLSLSSSTEATNQNQSQSHHYYYGVPIPPCAEGLENEEDTKLQGGNLSNLLIILSQLKGIDLGLVSYSDLFTRMSYERSETFFRAVLKEFDSAYLVSFLDSVSLGDDQPHWKERVIKIPSDSVHHWHEKREDLLDRLATFVDLLGDKHGTSPPIILVSAGILTNVLIHEMHRSNSKLSYVAVDGLLDAGHAAFTAKPLEHQLSENGTIIGTSNGGRDHSKFKCTMARYVREGDCVKAVGDRDLSPLCYSKGAKGKPVAGRIGGFFPHDHERKESLERKKKELDRKRKEEKLIKKKQAKLAKQERERDEKEEIEASGQQEEQTFDPAAADTGITSSSSIR